MSASRLRFVRTLIASWLGVCAIVVACAPPQHAQRVDDPALVAHLERIGDSVIGFACLPRAGDSTHFAVAIVLDSVRPSHASSVLLVRGFRSPAPRYQAVSIAIRRAGQTREIGTSCWRDAGIVIRASENVLMDASVALDAPSAVSVRVIDGRGRSLGDSVLTTQQGRTERIPWTVRCVLACSSLRHR